MHRYRFYHLNYNVDIYICIYCCTLTYDEKKNVIAKIRLLLKNLVKYGRCRYEKQNKLDL